MALQRWHLGVRDGEMREMHNSGYRHTTKATQNIYLQLLVIPNDTRTLAWLPVPFVRRKWCSGVDAHLDRQRVNNIGNNRCLEAL
jgi:hypothetical protein